MPSSIAIRSKFGKMPKAATKTRNSGGSTAPYGAKPAAGNHIFKMNTDLGQHVLKNPGIAQAIVDKADLKQSDVCFGGTLEHDEVLSQAQVVLEIGPGTGNLTVRILEKAKRCIAIEMDPRMAAEVTKRVQGKPEQKRLEVILGDAIKTPLPYFDVCISNTPYQISSPLTFKLLALSPAPRTCILMFQREFAMRLFAKPGDKLYSRLSVNAQMWAKIDHILKVGKSNFKPPPAVDSNVVRIVPKNPRPQISYDEWDGLLRVCFVRKNKTVRASFFGTTSVMDMLDSNYRTWCAQNNILLEDGPAEVNPTEVMEVEDDVVDDAIEEMDVDDDNDDIPDFFKEAADKKAKKGEVNAKRKRKGKVAELVREKVRRALEDVAAVADKRARMCDEGDFLRMLYAFNQEGIHFS